MKSSLSIALKEVQTLPATVGVSGFYVDGWSVLENKWEGVSSKPWHTCEAEKDAK